MVCLDQSKTKKNECKSDCTDYLLSTIYKQRIHYLPCVYLGY